MAASTSEPFAARCLMYLTGQHNVIPSDSELLKDITHVALAFMRSGVFNSVHHSPEFVLFTTVGAVRDKFHQGTKVMVAIGGWGDSEGFEEASKGAESRRRWCENVKKMIDQTGADGVDIDWEYPGGNRDDYKIIPNEKRKWEIEAFVQLLTDLRVAIGNEKLLSIAVPGLERDMMAFTEETIPRIVNQVDFINVMTYDLLNRRDVLVKHHTGVSASLKSVESYMARGAPAHLLNLGLAYYVKWAMTGNCDPDHLLGCPTQLLEDPETGADLGRISAFSWHDKIPEELEQSFSRAMINGEYFDDGSFGYWDVDETRWWTFDTPCVIDRKFKDIVRRKRLGGVFAWGLGEDAPEFSHLSATLNGLRGVKKANTGEAADKDEL
ncbi:chitinase 18-4 [Metarhizium album ARSEF 1941]|uniref:chitinase n=1 Tax=Metarhizium album (strain ARSEF 1941) TaxID=1081103 RepID=A0A0B2WHH1_METAS|nr:chitinase 18-4 [Metarhizium album ARSEF 1941]KHN95471.1 chitinase 18-4 [Metarhizium album ARSEF 1941]